MPESSTAPPSVGRNSHRYDCASSVNRSTPNLEVSRQPVDLRAPIAGFGIAVQREHLPRSTRGTGHGTDRGEEEAEEGQVRSAWISFAGRIVAQMVGAIATVALGVMVLHRYTANDAPPPAQQIGYAQPAPHIIVVTPAMLGVRDADERVWAADRSCAPSTFRYDP